MTILMPLESDRNTMKRKKLRNKLFYIRTMDKCQDMLTNLTSSEKRWRYKGWSKKKRPRSHLVQDLCLSRRESRHCKIWWKAKEKLTPRWRNCLSWAKRSKCKDTRKIWKTNWLELKRLLTPSRRKLSMLHTEI